MSAYREEVIGDARLILGDCREVLPTLGNVDACVIDPPYGTGFEGRRAKYRNQPSYTRDITYASHDDDPAMWLEEVRPALEAAVAKARSSAIFCATTRVTDMPPGMLGGFYLPNGCGLSSWGFTCFMPVMYYGKCPYLATGKGSRPTGKSGVYGNDSNTIDHPCASQAGGGNGMDSRPRVA